MTRASSVTRSATSLLGSRMGVAGIALIFLGVSTRLLTVEEMATFALYNTFCGLLTVVCSLGLLATCLKVLPPLTSAESSTEQKGQASRLLRLSVAVYVAGAVVVTALLVLAADPISNLILKTEGRAHDVRAAAVAALCFGLYECSQLMLSALQRFAALGGYNLAAALAQRTLSLALFFTFGLDGYLAGFAIGSLAGAALGLRTIGPWLGPAKPGPANDESGAGWIRYSMPFYADGYLRYLYMHADQLLVGILLTPPALSAYFVCKRFIQYAQVLVTSLVDPLGAKVAELREADPLAVGRAYVATTRYIVLLFIPLATLLACLSPFLLAVVGGPAYERAVLPLVWLFLSLPLFAVFSHALAFLHALGRPRERPLANLVSMAAQAAGIVLLMPSMALAGLGAARAAGFGAAACYTRLRVSRELKALGPTEAPGALHVMARCAAPVVCMALIVTVPYLALPNPWLLPLYALPGTAVCLVGYRLWVLGPSDLTALRTVVPGEGRGSRAVRSAIGRFLPSRSAGRP